MVKQVVAKFIAPHDPSYGPPGKEKVILLEPDVAVSVYGDELVFRFLKEPFNGVINLETCKRFELLGITEKIDPEIFVKSSFLEVIRKLAK